MGTKVNSNYEDLISFVRASSSGRATALRPVSYGDELVTNGTFDSDTSGWTSSSAFTATLNQSAGELSVTSTGNYGRALQAITCEIGKIYSLTCDVTEVGTTALVVVAIASSGTVNNAVFLKNDITSTQTVTAIFVATQQTHYVSVGNQDVNTGVTSKFDNISVKEVLFDQPDGTLTLFEHPENVPRVEYDADGNRLGLLVEESRTNLVTYSEDFSNASWSKAASSIDLSVYGGATPDGQTSGFEITEPSTTSTHGLRATLPFTSGQVYTLSIFAKASTSDWCQLLFGAAAFPTLHQNFNLSTGEKGAGSGFDSSQIENFGGGWYRISITATATSTASTDIYVALTDNSDSTRLPSYAGDGTSGVYLYGAQVEAGSFPTSYIKNEGTTSGVTRSADVVSILVADFGYNQSAGTVVVEAKTFSNAEANHGDFALTDGATSPDLMSGSRTGSSVAGTYSTWYRTGGTTQANLVRTSAVEDNVFYKAGFCYKANDFAQSVDGGSILSDSSGTVPSRNSVVLIGDNYYGKLNGHIKSIKYFPRRLTNAQLVDLTS